MKFTLSWLMTHLDTKATLDEIVDKFRKSLDAELDAK